MNPLRKIRRPINRLVKSLPFAAWCYRKPDKLILGAWWSFIFTCSVPAGVLLGIVFRWAKGDPPSLVYCLSSYLASAIWLAMFGFAKVELTLDGKGCTIFIGIHKLGYSRHFFWEEINSVSISWISHSRGVYSLLALKGKHREIYFGSMLGLEHRQYFLDMLNLLLRAQKTDPARFEASLHDPDWPDSSACQNRGVNRL